MNRPFRVKKIRKRLLEGISRPYPVPTTVISHEKAKLEPVHWI